MRSSSILERIKSTVRSQLKRRPIFLKVPVVGLTTVVLSALLGMGLSMGLVHATDSPYGMVDPVDARYEAGYTVYIEQCATCHVALPPAVLPVESWQTIMLDPAHYGVSLGLTQFDQQLILNYLQPYSRRNTGRGALPYRLGDSDYFQALHPQVELPVPLNLRSCASCHFNADAQDYTISQ